MIAAILKDLLQGDTLTTDQLRAGFEYGIKQPEDPAFVAFITLLAQQGLQAEQLIALRQTFVAAMVPVAVPENTLDIVGTGGDGLRTVNISTAAALLVASMGYPVLKHGNRAVSSQAGSADVLLALGIDINASATQVAASLKAHNFGFCFAPNFHPALKRVKELRRHLGFPTAFNALGPLLNPGEVKVMVLGVASEAMQAPMATALVAQGVQRAVVVHCHGMDELNTLGEAAVLEINNGIINNFTIDPAALGLPLGKLDDLVGGDSEYNAQRILAVFSGEQSTLAHTIALNAAAALWLCGAVDDLQQGVARALAQLKSGNCSDFLKTLQVAATQG